MTKPEALAVSWLHCNDCHRAFENHNKCDLQSDGRLVVTKSDLGFSFTSCGHFFCDNCVESAKAESGRFVCKCCSEASSLYKVEGRVPKNLEMYIKPPVSMLEDAVGVMLFQLNNANSLIRSLRSKVSQQKELLAKAKQELSGHKAMKEKLAQLTAENDQLKSKINNFISDSQDLKDDKRPMEKPNARPIIPPSPSVPNIKMNGRLSLKSPIMSTPPPFKSSNTSVAGYPGFFMQEPPQTPISANWKPTARHHPQLPTAPMMPMPESYHPHSHLPPPSQGYYDMHHAPPPPMPYYQQPQGPTSTFGSPRPFYRKGSYNSNQQHY